jgi:putative serine protease PepD
MNPTEHTQQVPRRRTAVVIAAAAGVVALTVGGGTAGAVISSLNAPPAATSPATTAAAPVPVSDRSSIAGVARMVLPSVVHIEIGEEEGSGVVLSADGEIVTNNHVIAGGHGEPIRVTFNDGKTVSATVIGTDPIGDIAVIRTGGVAGLTPATFGDTGTAAVGDTVLAIGSPLGLQGTVTQGIISALHRTANWEADGRRYYSGDAIQTDAAVNPGNSGGALINLAGEVIGINTAGYSVDEESSGSIGVNFAISGNKARAAAQQLIATGTVANPYLGVHIVDGPGGALLSEITAGSPAAKAGLLTGDIVTRADQRAVTDASALIVAIQDAKPGQALALTVTRDGAEHRISATLTTFPADEDPTD